MTAGQLPGHGDLEAMLAGGNVARVDALHASLLQRLQLLEAVDVTRDGRAVVSWPWKLIQEDAWSPRYEIYDLEADPRESRNLWDAAFPRSVRTEFLLQELRRLPATLSPAAERKFTPEEREAMRALGYIR